VLEAAYKKLFSGAEFNQTNEHHVFAVFAIRIGLEIGEGEASTRLAMEAVHNHMRILTSIAGRQINTAAPSEPILAVVAGRVLSYSSRLYQGAIETLLHKLLIPGLVLDRGRPGDLYARLLLMLARDKATSLYGGTYVRESYDGVDEVVAVRLSRFLRTLLGDDLGVPNFDAEQIKLRNQLLEEMDHAWINFTHFVKLSVPINEVTPSMLREAWSSGYAFQCASN